MFLACSAWAQSIGGCAVFPHDNVWNAAIDNLPVLSNSARLVATIGPEKPLVTDFGSGTYQGQPIGIPFVLVPGTQPKVPVSFQYAPESDPGPYPIPPNAPIEGGSQSRGDRHVLVLDRDHCILYEVYSAYPQINGSWKAGSGAIFPLKSNTLRPDTWTSADAAGLPILPGLVRYEEVAAGEIRHAIRFTAPESQMAYLWPARHYASSLTDPQYPPMGVRFRLKAGFDISGFAANNQVILRALKTYGMILADNGSSWYISGAPDEHWDNDQLHDLRRVQGSDFEAVDESSLEVDPNSGATRQSSVFNAASSTQGSVAPGEVVTIFGTNLGPKVGVGAVAANGVFTASLGGVSATFDGTPAPLLFVSSTQVNAIVPFEVAGKSTTGVQISYVGAAVLTATLAVGSAAPGIFTADSSGLGQAAALNQDFSANSAARPAKKGSVVMLYVTGGGQTDPAGVDGTITAGSLPHPKLPVTVSIGGQPADVEYAGNAPDLVAGVLQVNARIPANAKSGAVGVVVTVGAVASRSGVTLAVQ